MQKIFTTRWMWKTTQMLNYCNWKWIYIVCKDIKEVKRLWDIILNNKMNIPMPITINEKIWWNNKVFVDNVDLMVRDLKDFIIFKTEWLDIKIDIEQTLRYKYLKMWCSVEWYTLNIY